MWHSFETAPKDGREFIVRYPLQGNVLALISWDSLHNCWSNKGNAELGIDAQECLWTTIPGFQNSLRLEGRCTNHIWLMEDGEEPYAIGIRMDCGDSGVVYLTRKQAADLAEQLKGFLVEGERGEP